MHQENVKKTAYLTVFFSLYIAQAVPMSFFTTALQVILREQAVPLSIIGLLQVIKLPWILKVFWAPAVDRHCNTIRDYKRTIVGVEIVYALLVLLTSIFNLGAIVPSSFHFLIVIILLALMASATQDIATDALAIRTSSHQQRGLLNSMQSMGSFGGSLLGSGVLLMVLHKYGWSRVAQCLSVFVLIALIPLLLHKKLAFQQENKVKQRATWKDFGLFFRQKGISRQVIFLVLYYTGIIGVMSMLKPFMVDLGYSMKEIGFLCGIVGIGSAFVMAYPAGLFVRRWGYKRMRVILLLTLAIVVLWGSYGMGTVVVYTSSMQHVRAGREGTDFTVQTVITHLMGILISIICGIIANSIGYTGMFALQGAIALASFFYTMYMNEQSKDNERNTIQEI